MNYSRRSFLGGAAVLSLASVSGSETGSGIADTDCVVEPTRKLPVAAACDVIVVGGGPAGIAAAVSAARAGAKVRLLELQGSLGGIWTSGLMGCVFDFDKSSIDREIIRRLDACGARSPRHPVPAFKDAKNASWRSNFVYEPERMRIVCEEMCAEAGVRFTLQCPVVAAMRGKDGRKLSAVVTESKSGRQAWKAKCFIDCSGDGDLAALSGCGYDVGYGPDRVDQPASLVALVWVPDDSALARFAVNDPSTYGPNRRQTVNPKKELLAELRRAGISPSYSDPTLFRLRGGLCALMANHEYGLRMDDAQAITDATVRARAEVSRLVDALDALGGPWKGTRVILTAEQIGHRGARRIHGRATVAVEDVAAGRVWPDGVTTSNAGIDIHALTYASNEKQAAGQTFGASFRPFQIPLDALRAKDADNLFMAGRCISGDFIAQASYRMTGSAVAMGEAAGRAAAQLVRS